MTHRDVDVTATSGTIEVRFPDSESGESPAWKTANGWELRFVQLSPTKSTPTTRNKKTFAKVLSGSVISQEERRNVPTGRRNKRQTEVVPAGAAITAGEEGALILLTSIDTVDLERPVIDPVTQLIFTGPHSSEGGALDWVLVSSLPWAGHRFDGVQFWHSSSFRVFKGDAKVVDIRFWAAGVGVDCGWHDHGDATALTRFCEVHVGMHNGTGQGGMVVFPKTSGGPEERLTILPGEEHGAFWETISLSPGDLRPVIDSVTGAVKYPTHKWQSGGSAKDRQAFDVWIVAEFPPERVMI